MTRNQYLSFSLSLLGLLSLAGLMVSPVIYQIWLLERWPLVADSALLDFFYEKEMAEAYGAILTSSDVWLPFKATILALYSPAIPAFMRLRALGMRSAWGLLGLVPGLNLVFFVYLGLRPDTDRIAGEEKGFDARLLLPLGCVAGFLCYCLLWYLPWLAAKS